MKHLFKFVTWSNAFWAALVSFILTLPFFGIMMRFEGSSIQLTKNFWQPTLIAAMIFIVAILLPILRQSLQPFSHLSTTTLSIRTQNILIGVLIIGAIIFPLMANRTGLSIATSMCIYIILGLGLNIVVGFTGLLVLGYAAFYAVGAYTYAILNHLYGWSFWMCLPISGFVAALFGFLLGFPVLRLRGDYLAIVTLGFGEIILNILENASSLTGGPDGINGIDKPSFFGLVMQRSSQDGQTFHQFFGLSFSNEHRVLWMYVIALMVAVFTLWMTRRLQSMPIGRSWEALREDEIACSSLGMNPAMAKVSAFVISASFAGLAGAVFAAHQGSITPSAFTFLESAMILAIVVLGGMGSAAGIIIAAMLVVGLNNAQWLAEYRMLIFGGLLVAMMLWRPQGLLPAERPVLRLVNQKGQLS